jgi:hypothetical protein
MKKVILSLVFVLATGMSFVNATATNDEILPTTKEAIEVVEEFGCARDCVDSTLALFGDSPNNHPQQDILMALYLEQYEKCYNYYC